MGETEIQDDIENDPEKEHQSDCPADRVPDRMGTNADADAGTKVINMAKRPTAVAPLSMLSISDSGYMRADSAIRIHPVGTTFCMDNPQDHTASGRVSLQGPKPYGGPA